MRRIDSSVLSNSKLDSLGSHCSGHGEAEQYRGGEIMQCMSQQNPRPCKILYCVAVFCSPQQSCQYTPAVVSGRICGSICSDTEFIQALDNIWPTFLSPGCSVPTSLEVTYILQPVTPSAFSAPNPTNDIWFGNTARLLLMLTTVFPFKPSLFALHNDAKTWGIPDIPTSPQSTIANAKTVNKRELSKHQARVAWGLGTAESLCSS